MEILQWQHLVMWLQKCNFTYFVNYNGYFNRDDKIQSKTNFYSKLTNYVTIDSNDDCCVLTPLENNIHTLKAHE